ncbi:SMC domain protein [Thermanaeromonas toyohensis ToBE]|uniref:Nuclease SbcCD subunit C n=1 Tax=Thermanaeromonas toyohensis ToBE TaxID=698762 RepID=A0A1W1VXM3_9FIRM|nr:AAA family ATPase [Thermanaeromonas toyohensis]SMB98000.1 SMC domain protein [Thermanaeromonas toyohensis ToBE]
MKLLRLTLKNFKGIRRFTLEPNGANCTVYGANEAGKTSLVDAYLWLLFGRDSQNRADFAIKTLDQNGQVIPGLEHEVEGVFDLDGRKLTLRRVFREKWTKKRGSATTIFSGHETLYYVDGVPVKEKEYQARVAALADETVFRLLTDPYHFNRNLSWQERRRILMEICGDITDQEVIVSDPSLSELPSILGNRSIDDHRKIVQARMSKINQELREIPTRIDEATRALPDVPDIDEAELQSQIKALYDVLAEKQAALAQVSSGGAIAEAKVALRECEAEIQRLRNEQAARQAERTGELRRKLIEAKGQVDVLTTEIAVAKRRMVQLLDDAQAVEREINSLRIQWHERNKQEFVFEQDTICPTCGQPLPQEKLTEAREKALAEFNLAKARDLEEISNLGKRRRAEYEEIMGEYNWLSAKLAEMEAELVKRQAEVDRLKAELEAANNDTDIALDNAIKAAMERKAELEAEIERLQADNREAIEKVRREIDAINGQIKDLSQTLARIQARKAGLARIEELKAQEKALAAEYERLEKELYLCEQFVRTKVNLLEERINSKFRYARFKLFEQQVNGGIAETCVTLYKGVPYPDLNGAAKINIGLDIINTLAEHYGFYAPIFIDERESVTNLIPVNSQVISLVVSPRDKTLRVEIEEDTLLKEAI